MYRVSLGVLLGALCLLALRVPGLAHTSVPPSAQPTFRSTLDLLTLDTSVRDKGGQPVPDLQPSDFTVTIDGRPRKVVSAVFFKADPVAGDRLIGGAAPTPQYVANDRTQPGRVVIFWLDAGTIRPGQERALFETASRMLDGLSPADAVGLVDLPFPGIELTRDHSAVAEALKRFRGRAPSEVEGLGQGSNTLATPSTRTGPLPTAGQARGGGLLDLANLLRGLAVVRAPRSVILISGGIAFDPKLREGYKELERAAAESRVPVYTILLEDVGYDVSRGEKRPDVAENPAKTDGLATISAITGGMFFNAAGRAVGIFDRIQSEVNSFYQLAIESSPADADGKQHDVKVRVSRAGVDVRASSHVAVAKPPSKPAPRDPLLLALRQPTDVPDVPLAVTTYSTHAAGNAIQLLVSAEVGAPDAAAPTEWGLVVTQKGKDVAIRRGRFPAGSERPRVVSTSLEVPPGDYRLRLAAVDAEDRIGVLEVPFTAGYQTAANTKLSDLVVGVAGGGELEPRRSIARSEELTAMLQVADWAGAMPGAALQLVPAGSARSVLSIPFSTRPAASAGLPATLQMRASLATVPPGRYTASAVLEKSGQPFTRIDRVIEITGPRPVMPPTDVVATPAGEAGGTTAAPNVPVTAPAAAPAGSPDEIMRRVGAYVENYGGQASLLIGVEHYSQTFGLGNGLNRRLVSEFALVQNASASGGWLGYRDVIEMDGKPVADRRDRLQALFRSGAPDFQAAGRIADESARYNIGPVSRNFNVPTTTLFFFHSESLRRFTFRRTGRERIEGVDTVVIDFREARLPTLIMNSQGKDVPASGTLWVNPLDGAIVRTRLELGGFDDAGSRAVVDVAYQKDKALAMWVPSLMTERYSGGSSQAATTVATYKDFKRFQTSVKIR